jgi:hypothetical protein
MHLKGIQLTKRFCVSTSFACILLAATVVSGLSHSFAQKGKQTSDFCSALKGMLAQTSSGFERLKGELISETDILGVAEITWECKATLPGATSCTVFLYEDQHGPDQTYVACGFYKGSNRAASEKMLSELRQKIMTCLGTSYKEVVKRGENKGSAFFVKKTETSDDPAKWKKGYVELTGGKTADGHYVELRVH